jgi:hypothetical protein
MGKDILAELFTDVESEHFMDLNLLVFTRSRHFELDDLWLQNLIYFRYRVALRASKGRLFLGVGCGIVFQFCACLRNNNPTFSSMCFSLPIIAYKHFFHIHRLRLLINFLNLIWDLFASDYFSDRPSLLLGISLVDILKNSSTTLSLALSGDHAD